MEKKPREQALRRPALLRSRLPAWIFAALWLIALLAVQWRTGELLIRQTNFDRTSSDQADYLRMAHDERSHWWPTFTDGTRNPLFPWMLSFAPARTHDQEFFAAKQFNLKLGLLLSAALAAFLLTRLSPIAALNVTTLSVLGAILPLSTFVGAEVLFYGLFFCLWLICWHLLVRNPIWAYALAGLIAALAYLAKPSTLLLLLVFFFLSGLRALDVLWHQRDPAQWSWRRLVLGSLVFNLCFLMPVLPRALQSSRRFGAPFHNSSQYCFWAENWEFCYPRMAYFNPKRIQELPAEERPSASNWWHRHSFGDALTRLNQGVLIEAENFFLPEKRLWRKKEKHPTSTVHPVRLTLPRRGLYPVTLLAAALGLTFLTRGCPSTPESQSQWRRAGWWLLAGAFSLHFVAFAWYAPIAAGARFILGLWLPVLFVLASILESLRQKCAGDRRELIYHCVHGAIAAALLFQLFTLAQSHQFETLRGAF